jgi:uncharacterized cofD-like protein
MILNNRKILEGEKEIYLSQEIDEGYSSIYLEPYAKANPRAIDEIMNADLVVIGPGGLHTSLIPNLLVEGVGDALRKSAAKKVFVVNLMNRKGQTTAFKVSTYLKEIERFIGEDIFDYVLVNNEKPSPEQIELYAQEGDLVENDMEGDERVIATSFLGGIKGMPKVDLIKRSLIRHDSKKLAKEIMKIVNHL